MKDLRVMQHWQISNWFNATYGYILYIWQRAQKDSVRQWAASLTYTTLLAIVPLFSVSFAIFSAFPAYQNLKTDIQSYFLEFFVPEVGPQIKDSFETFVSSTGSLTAIGIVFLVVTSVLLLLTINIALNRIFHVKRDKALVPKLLMFWAVLTIVPMLLGAGLSLIPIIQGVFTSNLGESSMVINTWIDNLLQSRYILPVILETCALLVLFMAVPNTHVPFKDAFRGALLAAVVLELLKAGFALYLKNSSYSTIYGAFATVPMFFIWLFFCWNIILFAAVIVASMPEWRGGVRKIEQLRIDAYSQFHTAIAFLNGLWEKQKVGGRAFEPTLIAQYCLVPWILHTVTDELEKEGWIQQVGERGWVLARDLDGVALYELFEIFVSDRPHKNQYNNQQWQGALDNIMRDIQEERQQVMHAPVSQLFK